MRRLVVALCLLLEASTGKAQFILPRQNLQLQALFEVCLRRGFNAGYCECWANQLSSQPLTPQDADLPRLYGRLPPHSPFKLDAAHLWCVDLLP